MSVDAPTMARKKTPKAAPDAAPQKSPALSIRASVEWRDWLQRAAEHCRTDAAKLIDAAVIEYAKKRGFNEEAPRR